MALEVIKNVIWVKDMDRAIEFYERLFGLSLKFQTDHWSELTFGESIVALHGERSDGAVDTGLSFQVSDAEETVEHCTELGGRVVAPPKQRPGEPIILAHIEDPEQNVLMVTQWIGD